MSISYADITFRDPNPIKRQLQLWRLIHALKLARQTPDPRTILDFGAGNGELCKLLRPSFPRAEIYCYEPASHLMEEARRNVGTQFRVDFLSELNTVKSGSIDIVFCLEVFEHLPLKETAAALDAMARMLSSGGHLIIGVPIEVGFPALYKGLFRMWRRYGAFDANWRNVQPYRIRLSTSPVDSRRTPRHQGGVGRSVSHFRGGGQPRDLFFGCVTLAGNWRTGLSNRDAPLECCLVHLSRSRRTWRRGWGNSAATGLICGRACRQPMTCGRPPPGNKSA